MRLNDKIQFLSKGEAITCTATFCYLKGKKNPWDLLGRPGFLLLAQERYSGKL